MSGCATRDSLKIMGWAAVHGRTTGRPEAV